MRDRVALVTALFVLLAAPATGRSEVGQAKAIVDTATASGEVGDRRLAIGSVVFLGDRVTTDGQGEAQLLFQDGTRMVVGPDSELVIDEFVFRSQQEASRFSVRALGGAFRFISGDAPKDAYLISTPAAAIGVRGTGFDLNVSPGETDLLLLHKGPPDGGAIVCAPGSECETADELCDLVNADRGEGVELEDDETRAEKLGRLFPLVLSQEGLGDAFRIDDEDIGVCLALLEGQQSTSAGPISPGPIPGPGLPELAGPVAGFALIGAFLGFVAQEDDTSGPSTTTGIGGAQ